jgi:hypothetical protein
LPGENVCDLSILSLQSRLRYEKGRSMKTARISRTVLVVALAGIWLAGMTMAAERSASGMATAANRFLGGLSPEQRQQASFAIDSEERTRWHFIPTNMHPRKGVPIKEMSEPQRALARDLLKAGLSQRGYLTVSSIMDLETVLKALETGGRNIRDPELYFFSVFGTPGPKSPWGWRVEGHHLSLHFVIANGTAVASSPAFLGSNPAEIKEGPQAGKRVLGPQEDTARALLLALDPAQRTAATFATDAPTDIVTMTKLQVEPLSPAGLPASGMKADQRALLMRIIEAYASTMADDIASDRMAKLKSAGLDKITFAWAGPAEAGQKHYYRVQGPTFLIEYDNTQNNGNHVHSVWRDFEGDFGRDLLREHLKTVAH